MMSTLASIFSLSSPGRQYEMSPARNASLRRCLYCTTRTLKIMTSVYARQRLVVHTLNAVLHSHIAPLLQRSDIVQLLLIHAVGTCAYDKPLHQRVRQSLLVALFQRLQGSIGI